MYFKLKSCNKNEPTKQLICLVLIRTFIFERIFYNSSQVHQLHVKTEEWCNYWDLIFLRIVIIKNSHKWNT